jgi:hypothetical protein
MKILRPENNPTHTITFIPSRDDLTTFKIDGVQINIDSDSYEDGYLTVQFPFIAEEGKQYELDCGDIYKSKLYATDQADLNDYVINPVNGNVITL